MKVILNVIIAGKHKIITFFVQIVLVSKDAVIFKDYLPIQEITLPALQSLEATGVKLQTSDSDVIIIAAYKQPPIPLNTDDIRPHSW